MPKKIALASLFFAMLVSGNLVLNSSVMAQGPANVTIAPTRLVFEGRTRSGELVLVNRGESAATYRINVINMTMGEDGKLVKADTPKEGEFFANEMIKFSPRQIKLEPNDVQRVRIMIRKPANLPDGEYRSHLLFQSVPEATTPTITTSDSNGLSLKLNIVSGISIAIIVRHGSLEGEASLSELEFKPPTEENTTPSISIMMKRKGNRSVYGDFSVDMVHPGQTEAQANVSIVKGVAVYPPNAKRALNIPLTIPEGTKLENSKLIITYRERQEDGGRVLAQSELSIPESI